MKAALGGVHGLFGVLCADFCVRIFVRIFGADFWCGFFGTDFSVRIFRCGFFGADFSVRIFRCGFWCGFLGGFFSGFFLQGDRRESDKRNPAKNPSKTPSQNPPQNFLSKNPPQNPPQIPLRTFAVGPHLDSKEMWVHTVMPLWRLAPKVVAFWQQVAVVDTG